MAGCILSASLELDAAGTLDKRSTAEKKKREQNKRIQRKSAMREKRQREEEEAALRQQRAKERDGEQWFDCAQSRKQLRRLQRMETKREKKREWKRRHRNEIKKKKEQKRRWRDKAFKKQRIAVLPASTSGSQKKIKKPAIISSPSVPMRSAAICAKDVVYSILHKLERRMRREGERTEKRRALQLNMAKKKAFQQERAMVIGLERQAQLARQASSL